MSASLALGAVVAGCTTPPALTTGPRAIEIRRADTPFTYSDGAEAKRQADAECGGSVKTSIYDRFDDATGAWVYPGGCA